MKSTSLLDAKTFINSKGKICKYFYLDRVKVEVTPATFAQIVAAKKTCKSENDLRLTLLAQCTRFDGARKQQKDIQAMKMADFLKIMTVFNSLTFNSRFKWQPQQK